MRPKIILCIVLLSTAAYSKDPKAYLPGTVLRMDSIKCGTDQKSSNVAGEIVGSDSQQKQNRELLCQEYLLQGENVVYRIRPRDIKHPTLLTVGNRAEFRLQKDKMYLRVEEINSKERTYDVVSMAPRTDSDTADNISHVNHLQ